MWMLGPSGLDASIDDPGVFRGLGAGGVVAVEDGGGREDGRKEGER